MNVVDLIDQANRAGVTLSLTNAGTVKVSGNEDTVAAIIPAVRQHKPEIIAMLQGRQERALHLARLAIARAALSDGQKLSRLADLRKAPGIAGFWAQLQRDDLNAEKAKE
jgi:hypothetical protein